MSRPKKPKQQTIEATLGQPRIHTTIRPLSKARASTTSMQGTLPKSLGDTKFRSTPRSSFASSMPSSAAKAQKHVVIDDSSSESAEENVDVDSDDGLPALLPERRAPRTERKQATLASMSSSSAGKIPHKEPVEADEDSDDLLLLTPASSLRWQVQKRPVVIVDDEEDDDEEDELPTKRRRLSQRPTSSPRKADADPDSDAPRSSRASRGKKAEVSSPTKRGTRKTPRTDKEKMRELLRRRRAGENVDEDDITSSSDDGEEQKGLYDTDSDHLALKDFEDDDEQDDNIEQETAPSSSSKSKKNGKARQKSPKKKTNRGDGDHQADESDPNLEDFVVSDSDAPLGAPAELLDMPLEFTAHAHKPLKEHFRVAVEWLVQTKINPGFAERRHALYLMAWRRLDDEFRGLAESKFSSSAWKQDFVLALRARPYIESVEVAAGGGAADFETCEACGRRNHPARWTVMFRGTVYRKNSAAEHFLENVEADSSSDSDSSGSDGSDGGGGGGGGGGEAGRRDYDEEGRAIPSEERQWFAGSVCSGNAETAHSLMHWKKALQDFVAEKLEREGWMTAEKLKERENMGAKRRYKQVDKVMEAWTDEGVVANLYGEFKGLLETARNKTTTGKSVKGGGWK